MKVPNRVIEATIRLLNSLPDSEDKKLVMQWANEGKAKRSAAAATALAQASK